MHLPLGSSIYVDFIIGNQKTRLTWESLVPLANGRGLCSKALYVSEVCLRVEQPLRLGWWGHKHWAGGLLERWVSYGAMSWVRWWSLLPWAHLMKIRLDKSLSRYLTVTIISQCRNTVYEKNIINSQLSSYKRMKYDMTNWYEGSFSNYPLPPTPSP